ncbi:aldo/keto reductase [Litoribacter alkaliphilus]|uniref:Aldo/keto reductase n=1 Tax=Litoribacter ruber TaxID=702568 RepID=A0AAP2CH59_9BACT|nr:aldo/keto reductase [Litoribacter alkaliphilus]MBS9524611.1 aldo/keto reductase [Litoribacter alkaliphilus]
MKSVKFENGDEMPILGLGTWKSKPGEVYDAVLHALKCGYRHIDCAPIYQNEKEVGKALQKAFKDGIVTREEIFVTSKLWNNAHKKDQVIPALEKTLKDLKLDYLDLYLIHWPVAQKEVNVSQPADFLSPKEVPLLETWEGMEEAFHEGLTLHIGVSNFNIKNLTEILDNCEVMPEMNQVELHPLLPQNDLIEFCHENGVQVTAYSPLGSTDRTAAMKKDDEPNLMENETIQSIAKKHNISPAQVLIAWAMERDTVVIPKSVNEGRIKENFESLKVELDQVDLEKIAKIKGPYRFVDGTFWTMEGSPYKLEDLWD